MSDDARRRRGGGNAFRYRAMAAAFTVGMVPELPLWAQAIDGSAPAGAGAGTETATIIGAVGAAIIGIFVFALRAFGFDLRPGPKVEVRTTALPSKADVARVERKVGSLTSLTEGHTSETDKAIEDMHAQHQRIQESLDRLEKDVQALKQANEAVLLLYRKQRNGSDHS